MAEAQGNCARTTVEAQRPPGAFMRHLNERGVLIKGKQKREKALSYRGVPGRLVDRVM